MAPDNLKETGLVYVSDSEPGIRRQRAGRSFCYRLPDGSLVRDAALKARIAALGLPPVLDRGDLRHADPRDDARGAD